MDIYKGVAMSKTIVWKGRSFKGDPEKVYRELELIGETTPDTIVAYAETYRDSELHKCFTWDDTKAAENWRKQEARMLICSLQVVVVKDEKEPETYRLIQHDDADKVYRPVTFTVRNEDEYKRLLNQAKGELRSFKARYQHIVELSEIIEDIERLIS